ncbi:type II toxin-antitoxin system VapC family toxin [soil metagenome]
MARVVLDTDVLIDHLGGKDALSSELSGSSYSTVTRAELYSWKQDHESIIDRLLDQFDEVSVDRLVAEEAGRIRRELGVRLPDALIAATAIRVKRPLFTRNVRNYRKIKRLRLHPSDR